MLERECCWRGNSVGEEVVLEREWCLRRNGVGKGVVSMVFHEIHHDEAGAFISKFLSYIGLHTILSHKSAGIRPVVLVKESKFSPQNHSGGIFTPAL